MGEKFKVLVLYYSQTGKTKSLLDIFLEPLQKRSDVEITIEEILPKVPFPFPWPQLYFFSLVPECVINDHRFIPTDERMADVPCVIRRPMPIEEITRRLFAIPIPFHRSPEFVDCVAQFVFIFRVAIEVLPRDEQALYEKCGFDEIAAVIIFAEIGNGFAGAAI